MLKFYYPYYYAEILLFEFIFRDFLHNIVIVRAHIWRYQTPPTRRCIQTEKEHGMKIDETQSDDVKTYATKTGKVQHEELPNARDHSRTIYQ